MQFLPNENLHSWKVDIIIHFRFGTYVRTLYGSLLHYLALNTVALWLWLWVTILWLLIYNIVIAWFCTCGYSKCYGHTVLLLIAIIAICSGPLQTMYTVWWWLYAGIKYVCTEVCKIVVGNVIWLMIHLWTSTLLLLDSFFTLSPSQLRWQCSAFLYRMQHIYIPNTCRCAGRIACNLYTYYVYVYI